MRGGFPTIRNTCILWINCSIISQISFMFVDLIIPFIQERDISFYLHMKVTNNNYDGSSVHAKEFPRYLLVKINSIQIIQVIFYDRVA